MAREKMQDLPFAGSNTLMASCPSLPISPTLQDKLQLLLFNRPEWWVYAIFWRSSQKSEAHLLSFCSGHFRGKNDLNHKNAPKPYNPFASLLTDDVTTGNTVNCTGIDGDEVLERFYNVSLTYSVGTSNVSESVVQAYLWQMPIWLAGAQALVGVCGCQRSREAQIHGIETIVWVPLPGGVLELGSCDLIPQDSVLIQQV